MSIDRKTNMDLNKNYFASIFMGFNIINTKNSICTSIILNSFKFTNNMMLLILVYYLFCNLQFIFDKLFQILFLIIYTILNL